MHSQPGAWPSRSSRRVAVAAVLAAGWLSLAMAQERQDAQPASARDLRLSAKLDRTKIVPYQPLWLTVTVRNVSGKPVLLAPTPGLPLCRLEGPTGLPLEWGRAQRPPLVASEVPIESGEVCETRAELNHFFNLGRSPGRHKAIAAYPLLQKGRAGRAGRVKELKATVRFRVVEPQEQADRRALADFRRAIEQHMAWRGPVTDAVRAAYQQVVERHAESCYAEYAQYWLARSWHNPLDYRQAREAYQDFLAAHSESGYAEAAKRGLEQLGALSAPQPGAGQVPP